MIPVGTKCTVWSERTRTKTELIVQEVKNEVVYFNKGWVVPLGVVTGDEPTYFKLDFKIISEGGEKRESLKGFDAFVTKDIRIKGKKNRRDNYG